MNTNSGYVYVIADEQGRRKLGKAEDVDQRRNELQTGNADILTIEYRLAVKDMTKAELALHSLFAADRIRLNSEWFIIRNLYLLDKVFKHVEISEREYILLESLGLR